MKMLKELKEVNKFVSTRLYRNEWGDFDKLIAAFEKAVREDAASKAWKKLMNIQYRQTCAAI